LVGPWTVYGTDEKAVDLATGVRAALGDRNSLIVAEGSKVEEPLAGGIDAAVAAARQADIVVLAIGEAQNMSGEAQSRALIVMPEPQQRLAEAVAALGKPTVVILKNGRALALEGAVANAQAILVTWFLGTETGNAIADVLFGAYSPSGRLPVSFPRSPGQQPFYYSRKSGGRPNPPGPLAEYKTHYRNIPHSALYPFGHGLTYGRIEYGPLSLSAPKLASNGEITVSTRVTNRGRRAAEEADPRAQGVPQGSPRTGAVRNGQLPSPQQRPLVHRQAAAPDRRARNFQRVDCPVGGSRRRVRELRAARLAGSAQPDDRRQPRHAVLVERFHGDFVMTNVLPVSLWMSFSSFWWRARKVVEAKRGSWVSSGIATTSQAERHRPSLPAAMAK
jgi:hypothetical protein